MKHNIIFLDVDGVLNGYNFWNMLGWNLSCLLRISKWYKTHTRSPFDVHSEKVKRLAEIVHKTDARVVMSSSWRHMFWYVPYEEMNDRTQHLVQALKENNIKVIDITPKAKDFKRETEIKMWLANNKDKVKNFVILDDERYDLESFVGTHLVQTSSTKKGQMIMGFWYENTGLKRKHIKKAIKVLNQKED